MILCILSCPTNSSKLKEQKHSYKSLTFWTDLMSPMMTEMKLGTLCQQMFFWFSQVRHSHILQTWRTKSKGTWGDIETSWHHNGYKLYTIYVYVRGSMFSKGSFRQDCWTSLLKVVGGQSLKLKEEHVSRKEWERKVEVYSKNHNKSGKSLLYTRTAALFFEMLAVHLSAG